MKSNKEQLSARGYLTDEAAEKFEVMNEQDFIQLLHSKISCERTAAVRFLGHTKKNEFIPMFIELLKNEKKLYVNLELINCLSAYKQAAVNPLIALLGTIGNNQHTIAAKIDLKKKSYPLPRDISARILIKIGPDALKELENTVISGLKPQASEAIDCIGYISFYYNCFESEKVLFEALNKYADDRLIIWKIIRAFQSFRGPKVIEYLNSIAAGNDDILKAEALRSIERIKRRKL
ncbi:MAG: hypothetical protein QMC67_08725 [Candidatus Wallbacteria bacterium]